MQNLKGIKRQSFHQMPPFKVTNRPDVADKLVSWIGIKPLDANQKRFHKGQVITMLIGLLILAAGSGLMILTYGGKKGPIAGMFMVLLLISLIIQGRRKLKEGMLQQDVFNAMVIYRHCMRYWNTKLMYQPPGQGTGPEANVTSKFRKNGFETESSLKVTSLNYFLMIPQDHITYICYESKKKKQPSEKKNAWGIYFRLFAHDSALADDAPFILVPVGNDVQHKKYTFEKRTGPNDLYIKDKMPTVQLEEVMKLMQPLLDRDIPFAVKYKTDLEIYLPHFLPLKKHIQTKDEVNEICTYINLWHDFYERSLLWRYGELPKEWVKGKENTLSQ